jgi:hypothetical protein
VIPRDDQIGAHRDSGGNDLIVIDMRNKSHNFPLFALCICDGLVAANPLTMQTRDYDYAR